MLGRMTMKDFQIIRTAEQIGSLAHGQRLELLRRLIDRPLTATMVAKEMGVPVNQVHYHVRQLVAQSLVAEVDEPRHRKDERYYRATARQYLVDPGLTSTDDTVSQSVRQFLEASAVSRRGREVLDLNLGEIARRVAVDSLGVMKGQRVLVLFAPTALELAEVLIVELQALGADVRTKIWSRNVILQTLDRHTAESLETLPFVSDDQDRDLDTVIMVTSTMPQGPPPNPQQREKLPLLLRTVAEWQRSLLARRIRSFEINLPHRGEFEGGWSSPEEAIDAYWRCLNAESQTLLARGNGLKRIVGERPRWYLSDARGSSLELDVPPAQLHVSDGRVDADDLARGRSADVLPAGQIFGIPTPESARGSVWADYTYIAGRHFHDVRLVIEKGRIVEATARHDADALLEIIRRESGDSDVIAGVGIGVNPGGQVLTGRPSLDGQFEGVVTISFGDNELDGGNVRSTLRINLPSRAMTATVGDRTLVSMGVLRDRGDS
ncbi:MAG: helix-turn-helix domain-containing protein [Candidatus Eisenbacteria bacterium]